MRVFERLKIFSDKKSNNSNNRSSYDSDEEEDFDLTSLVKKRITTTTSTTTTTTTSYDLLSLCGILVPQELILQVLLFIPDARSLSACHRINHAWDALIRKHENALWMQLCEVRWGKIRLTWKNLSYKNHFREKLVTSKEGFLTWDERWFDPDFDHPLLRQLPSRRYRCSANAVGNKIIYIGGVDDARQLDFYMLDADKLICEQQNVKFVNVKPLALPNLARHCAVEYDGCIYCFSGIIAGVKTNSLYVYDVALNTFTCLDNKMSGDIPSPRADAAAARIGNCMYVFGGSNVQVKPENGLYCLNLNTLVWTKVQDDDDPNKPTPRSCHSMISKGSRLIIYGGGVWTTDDGGRFQEEYPASVHIFDADTGKWIDTTTTTATTTTTTTTPTRTPTTTTTTTITTTTPTTTTTTTTTTPEEQQQEQQPTTSTFVTLFSIGMDMYLFGGGRWSANATSGALYAYDLLTFKWRLVSDVSEKWSTSCTSAAIVGPHVYLFGGFRQRPLRDFRILRMSTRPSELLLLLLSSSSSSISRNYPEQRHLLGDLEEEEEEEEFE